VSIKKNVMDHLRHSAST